MSSYVYSVSVIVGCDEPRFVMRTFNIFYSADVHQNLRLFIRCYDPEVSRKRRKWDYCEKHRDSCYNIVIFHLSPVST